METITFDKDIKVLYYTAASYPAGIMQAHEKLHSLIPFSEERKYFGISRPEENGSIVYRAAAEELYPGEAAKYSLDTLVLKKGSYLCISIKDYINDIQGISRAFRELLSQPGLDPQGYCVEWYFTDKDVRCMIRLEQQARVL